MIYNLLNMFKPKKLSYNLSSNFNFNLINFNNFKCLYKFFDGLKINIIYILKNNYFLTKINDNFNYIYFPDLYINYELIRYQQLRINDIFIVDKKNNLKYPYFSIKEKEILYRDYEHDKSIIFNLEKLNFNILKYFNLEFDKEFDFNKILYPHLNLKNSEINSLQNFNKNINDLIIEQELKNNKNINHNLINQVIDYYALVNKNRNLYSEYIFNLSNNFFKFYKNQQIKIKSKEYIINNIILNNDNVSKTKIELLSKQNNFSISYITLKPILKKYYRYIIDFLQNKYYKNPSSNNFSKIINYSIEDNYQLKLYLSKLDNSNVVTYNFLDFLKNNSKNIVDIEYIFKNFYHLNDRLFKILQSTYMYNNKHLIIDDSLNVSKDYNFLNCINNNRFDSDTMIYYLNGLYIRINVLLKCIKDKNKYKNCNSYNLIIHFNNTNFYEISNIYGIKYIDNLNYDKPIVLKKPYVNPEYKLIHDFEVTLTKKFKILINNIELSAEKNYLVNKKFECKLTKFKIYDSNLYMDFINIKTEDLCARTINYYYYSNTKNNISFALEIISNKNLNKYKNKIGYLKSLNKAEHGFLKSFKYKIKYFVKINNKIFIQFNNGVFVNYELVKEDLKKFKEESEKWKPNELPTYLDFNNENTLYNCFNSSKKIKKNIIKNYFAYDAYEFYVIIDE